MRTIYLSYVLIFLSFLICISCSNDEFIYVNNKKSSTISLNIGVGPVGQLCNSSRNVDLTLYIVIEDSTTCIVNDTILLNAESNVNLTRLFESIPSEKYWNVKIETRDSNFIIFHEKDTSLYIEPNDTTSLSLVLPAKYSQIEANFYPLVDSIRRCELVIDSESVYDTSFMVVENDTVKSKIVYISSSPEGDTHNVVMNVYGVKYGKTELLYTGSSVISIVSGKDTTYTIKLNWVGPDNPPNGQMILNVSIGNIGTVKLIGELEKRIILSSGESYRINDETSVLDGLEFNVPDGALESPTQFIVKPIEDVTDSTFYLTLSVSTSLEYANDYIEIVLPVVDTVDSLDNFYYVKVESTDGEIISIMPVLKKENGQLYTYIKSFCLGDDLLQRQTNLMKSAIVTLMQNKSIIKPDIYEVSDFNRTEDVWVFKNNISNIPAIRGYCAAWASTVAWYFHRKHRRGEPKLYNLFDNNGLYKTEHFIDDNSDAIRFVIALQNRYNSTIGTAIKKISNNKKEITYLIKFYQNVLRNNMLAQLFLLNNTGGSHAVLLYKIELSADLMNAKFFIIDPNKNSNNEEYLEISTNTGMKQYGIYTNAGIVTSDYSMPETKISKAWSNFKQIDDNLFVNYKIRIDDDISIQELTSKNTFSVIGKNVKFNLRNNPTLIFEIFDDVDNKLSSNADKLKSIKEVELLYGMNTVGVKTTSSFLLDYYNDFQRYNIYCVDFEVDRDTAPPIGPIQFSVDPLITEYDTFEWDFGDGQSSIERNPIHEFLEPGKYTIKCKMTGPSYPEQIIEKVDFISIIRDTLRTYYASGEPKIVSEYTDTLREGVYRDTINHRYFNEYYKSGNKKSFFKYYRAKADSVATGFYDNDENSVFYTYTLKMDILDGDHFEYYPNEVIKKHIPFKDNEIYGIMKTYFENGELEKLTSFEEGESKGLNGELREYYSSNHSLKRDAWYKNDYLNGRCRKYTEQGILFFDYSYVNDTLNDTCRDYFTYGKMKKEVVWNKGIPIGNAFWWDDDDKYLTEVFYNNSGELHGTITRKFGDVIINQADYNNGIANGSYNGFFDDGSIQISGTIDNGAKTGVWNYYCVNGNDSCQYTFVGTNNLFKFPIGGDINRDYELVFYRLSENRDFKENYENGILHGDYYSYYDNLKNSVETKGQYEYGEKKGWWYRYDEEGEEINSTNYGE